ncbi:unnamed protein product [Larinioides sclopetarius]|uniref:Uncharacterized protein n=1 Tax=Larinioides sclopetarius TaxID=280406 RepID=A0AAV2BTR2_9ARAC
MFIDTNYQKIGRYFLFSFLCFVSIFSAATAKVATQRDDEPKVIHKERGNATLLDLLHSTTTKRYIQEDTAISTRSPHSEDYPKVQSSLSMVSYVILAALWLKIVALLFLCAHIHFKRKLKSCSIECHSHSPILS